jgi:ribosomal protein L11 methyltransferase
LAAVLAVDPVASCNLQPAAPVDWATAWRDHARVTALGSLTIAPPWLAAGLDPARAIVIDPGMAFGTGDHASTRGAVLMLHSVKPGMTVADLGSGSAVLSIAAAKLGAARVWAIEIDPEAQANAAENIDRNVWGYRAPARR